MIWQSVGLIFTFRKVVVTVQYALRTPRTQGFAPARKKISSSTYNYALYVLGSFFFLAGASLCVQDASSEYAVHGYVWHDLHVYRNVTCNYVLNYKTCLFYSWNFMNGIQVHVFLWYHDRLTINQRIELDRVYQAILILTCMDIR